jgi:hypothetical protein
MSEEGKGKEEGCHYCHDCYEIRQKGIGKVVVYR